ncbi:MAG: TatD family hydrolase [Propionivibrio sp.]
MLIDTHCHLDAEEFAGDRDAVVLAAHVAGVEATVVPAVGPTNWAAVRECCAHYPRHYPAYGIHPLYIDGPDVSVLPTLRRWITTELDTATLPVAIGEIGLDFFVPGQDVERQVFFFVEQLKVARDLNLPILLHVRRAVDQVLKCLRRIGVRGGIAHAFNGSVQQAEAFIRLGFKLGFGGAMTYPRSLRIRQLAMDLPLEALVLETDAPDIPPSWLAGKRNRPAELARIASVLAELRGLSTDEVAHATSRNALAVLPLSDDSAM